jgi:dihydropyrimidinase
MARTLISGGTVVTATETVAADVLVEDEIIVGVAGADHGWAATADRIIDASSRYVIPGAIDAHTHFDLPFGGTFVSDDFETGTRAAAHGGTTTIVDFANQLKGEQVMDGYAAWMAKAEGNCAIDYAFHMIVGDVTEDALRQVDTLIGEGVTSFKLFMAYPGVLYSDDGQIFRMMQRAAETGATIMMHAENGIAIDVLREQAIQRGQTDPKYHTTTRPPTTESEAVHRAIALAELAGAPLYVVHMSAKEAVAELTRARDRGSNVFGETCPQYLFLDWERHVCAAGFEGAKYVCSTPIRPRAEGHQEYLWNALARNDLQIVSTDHAGFYYDDDLDGPRRLGRQKRLGEGDFTAIPNGLPGVEERLNVMYQGGVVEGRISLNRWVEVCCTTPAKMFGLYPKKGAIAVGSDADIVVYDPNAPFTYSPDTIHMNVDYTAYDGMEVSGRPALVMLRGKVIVDDGTYLGSKGDGRYLPRGMSQLLI